MTDLTGVKHQYGSDMSSLATLSFEGQNTVSQEELFRDALSQHDEEQVARALIKTSRLERATIEALALLFDPLAVKNPSSWIRAYPRRLKIIRKRGRPSRSVMSFIPTSWDAQFRAAIAKANAEAAASLLLQKKQLGHKFIKQLAILFDPSLSERSVSDANKCFGRLEFVKKKGRPIDIPKEWERDRAIGYFVQEKLSLGTIPWKAVIQDAMHEFGVGRTTVIEATKSIKKRPST